MLHSPVAHAGVDVRCLSALVSQRLLNVVEVVPSTILAQGGSASGFAPGRRRNHSLPDAPPVA